MNDRLWKRLAVLLNEKADLEAQVVLVEEEILHIMVLARQDWLEIDRESEAKEASLKVFLEPCQCDNPLVVCPVHVRVQPEYPSGS